MSGGSYSYTYRNVADEYEGRMYDAEMDDLIGDLCVVLKAVEWWQSADISEESYREKVKAFKKKWLNGDRETRLKGYIDKQVGMVREELYKLIGEEE